MAALPKRPARRGSSAMRPAVFADAWSSAQGFSLLLEDKVLLILAGLLFLSHMPTLVGVGFGVLSHELAGFLEQSPFRAILIRSPKCWQG
jgi:hypothetical protein